MATAKRPPETPGDDTADERPRSLHLIVMPDGHAHTLIVKGAERTVVCPLVGCGKEYPSARAGST